jgi:hypothetical protein
MSYARQPLDTYPRTLSIDADRLATTIRALSDCAPACTADTDADLARTTWPRWSDASACAWTAPISALPLATWRVRRRRCARLCVKGGGGRL